MSKYDFKSIEAKWQAFWDESQTFLAKNPGDAGFDPKQPKYYVLDMFPYPSGAGLHVGHPLGYIATDIISRYKRTRGFNVLHPMGFDAFGLPAEQYAVETGTHPSITTGKNVETYRRQLKALGFSYDWSREVQTTDEDYYRWTQWIFLQLFKSWVDPRTGKAAPLTGLIQELESGKVGVGENDDLDFAGGGRSWSDLDETEQESVLSQHRIAFLSEVPVNWCPQLGTVLANEEVTNDGRSERGNFPVYKRPLKQWMLRITAYADRLLEDLEALDWPEALKLMQRNWIGKSKGARVRFQVQDRADIIEVFTTRPDTLFGATYMVLAPEHGLVDEITHESQREAVETYRKAAANRSDLDRQLDQREKDGVFTGAHAINPVSGEAVPIWIADYVLMGYGTGAIMAVPAHDQRDFEFARTFDLPIRPVVKPGADWLQEASAASLETYLRDPSAFSEAFSGTGEGIHSENAEVSLNGLETAEAKAKITDWLEAKGLGSGETQYKLRDWLFSRQRYWGEPFPVLHGPNGIIRAVEEDALPVTLPPLDDFRPRPSDDPEAPPQTALSRAPEDWKQVTIDGVVYERELNTMPQWAGSCWYYLRYIDPKNEKRMVSREDEDYWMAPTGIDLYVGGVEHAVLHLLYARFWHKVLFDLGEVSTREPFQRLFNQGYIQAYAYQDERGVYLDANKIEEKPAGTFTYEGKPVSRSLGKMGKSLKNSVSPDEIIEQYGCDTLRLYEMYLGPIEQSKPWSTKAIVGVHRFLQRLWRNLVEEDTDVLLVDDTASTGELKVQLHKTIAAVTDDMEAMRFNTAIARLIELNNTMVGLERIPRDVAEAICLMVSPMAPHTAEELWQRLGHQESLAYVSWPSFDPEMLVENEIDVVVQVMGKKRGSVRVPADAAKDAIEAAALENEGVQRHIEGKTVRKVIYVPGKLINIVAN